MPPVLVRWGLSDSIGLDNPSFRSPGDAVKKFLIFTLVLVAVVVLGGYFFKDPLMEVVAERVTSDMFVTADKDGFDPGLAIGQPFPAINAITGGAPVSDVMQYAGANGLVFFANRSVSW